MKTFRIVYVFIALFAISEQTWSNNPLELQEVAQDVYAIVGELGNRSRENFGNNSTFGFVVTKAGVVLIDSGGTYEGAKAIAQIIKKVTDEPVVKVINTGGQDHRWLGNDFFKNLGAEIIANKITVKDQQARVNDELFILANLVGEDAIASTTPVYADTTFDREYTFSVGGTKFEIHYAGPAHTPGDSFVWLPSRAVMFTGDIVFTDRLLGVLEHSNSKSWMAVYQSMAKFNPEHIVPGHGPATDLTRAKHHTYDYLSDLRQAVSEFMQDGGDISEIREIDQSKYKHLLNYDALSGRNAQRVYSELEWE